VYQPLGDEGPWAVLEAKTDYVSISLDPGTQLRDGSTAYAGGSIPTGEHAVLGYHATADGCGDHSDTTAFERVGTDAASDQTSGGISLGSYSRGQLQFTLPPQTEECRAQAGYVFVAITDHALASTDPLGGIPVTTGVLGFAAVPVSFLFQPQDAGSPPPSSSLPPSPIAAPTHGYTDPLGWTIDVPDGWMADTVHQDDGRIQYDGAIFDSGRPTDDPGAANFPTNPVPGPGDVMVKIFRMEGGLQPALGDDSSFPLDPDSLLVTDSGKLAGSFRGDGQLFAVTVETGDGPQLTPAEHEIVWRMISSIRFVPWEGCETRNGWASVCGLSGQTQQAKEAGIAWMALSTDLHASGMWVGVYVYDGGNGKVLGPVDSCGEGEGETAEVNAQGVWVAIDCPDGSVQRWTTDGQPALTNSAEFSRPLAIHPVIKSWDGTLLTDRSVTATG
jgi:hypothetical protein